MGDLHEGGTCLDRLRALQRLGHSVEGLDAARFRPDNRLLASIHNRLKPRFQLASFNRAVLERIAASPALDMVWIDKGVWVFPETVREIKQEHHVLAVHFTPDAQFMFNQSRHFVSAVPHYDHLITTKSFELQLYVDAGAPNVIFTQQSFCPDRYSKPTSVSDSVPIGFIGHYEKHYDRVVRELAAKTEVGVWGDSWLRGRFARRIRRHYVRGGSVFGADYVNYLASFQIGLGLLSKYFPEQHTTRSFEIPAAGTFLLAERSDEHLEFFSEGEEAEFFDSTDELLDKAAYYLENEASRRSIAAKGRERCLTGGYDTDTVLNKVIDQMI